MSLIGTRRSEMTKMDTKSSASNYIHMEFMIPSRGLFGLNARLLTATQGRAIMHHTFEQYEPMHGSIPAATGRRHDRHRDGHGHRLCPGRSV